MKLRKTKPLQEIIFEAKSLIQDISSVIVVEGKRDASTLISLGIPKQSIIIKSGLSTFRLTDLIQDRGCKQVIPLYDFDYEGKKLLKDLLREIDRIKDIKINRSIRRDLYRLARSKGVTEIEDILSVEL